MAGSDDDGAERVGDKRMGESGDGGGSGDVSELRGAGVKGLRGELEGSVAGGRNELA